MLNVRRRARRQARTEKLGIGFPTQTAFQNCGSAKTGKALSAGGAKGPRKRNEPNRRLVRVVVTGGAGMLGSDVVAELQGRGHEVLAPSRIELDITDPSAVAEIPGGKWAGCQWCINCAAYTFVDKAEEEPDAAMLANGLGPGYLAQACQLAGTRLLHISTDFAFDGSAKQPYAEDQPTNPQGAYARSKVQGEEAVLVAHANAIIARTAWLYGPNGNSFPKTIIRAWMAEKNLRVVSDQTGSPTYTADIARVLVDLVEKDAERGIYHTAGPDAMSWDELAVLALTAYRDEVLHEDRPISVEPIRTEDWPTLAKRPKYSVLSFEKTASLGIKPMRATEEALREFVARLERQ